MLELRNLTKTYVTGKETFHAVDGINLSVDVGNICVLLGTSGCGKTTTLKMINRLVEPTSGDIFINGKKVFDIPLLELRRNIGYVIQSIGLFPNMTIFENITVVPRLLGWSKDKRQKRANILLEMVGLPTTKEFQSRHPHQLSGGQQQRIGVIRAIAGQQKLLLMDEAFSAIDPINRAVIQDEFKRIAKEHNLSVVFVSHDVDEALKLADTVAIFDKGKIIQKDSPKELLFNPKNAFINEFIGGSRHVKLLQLYHGYEALDNTVQVDDNAPKMNVNSTLSEISSKLYTSKQGQVICLDDLRNPVGVVTHDSIHHLFK